MLKEIFLQRLNLQSKTVNNAIITLGDIDDSGKGKRFKSRFIQPGLAGYPGQFGTVLVKKETLDNSLNTIIGAPVIINHTDVTEENADDLRVGVISNAYYNEKDGWYWCDGVIWDETAQNLITDKKWSVSCSYDFLQENDEGGTENNIPYDREFTKLNFVHLALVDNPRYERAKIVFNSKTDNSFDPNQKRDEKGRWTKENYNAEIDKIIAGKYPRGKQIKVKDKPSEIWLNAGLQDTKIILPVGVYEKSTTDKHNVSERIMRNLPDLLDDPIYIFKSSTQPDSFVGVLDDFEEENGIKKPLIAAIKPTTGQTEVNILTSIYGKDKNFSNREILKGNLLYEKLKNKKTISNSIVASIATETSKPSVDIITYILKNFNPDITKHEVHNTKEQEMALLEELKKLINNVENGKGDKMDDKDDKKEVENEKVDKRKLIDEVGGILKGKVDEEVWRTIIGKIEKVAYDESSRGTADNEKVDKRDVIRKIMAIAGKHEDNEDVRTIAKLAEKLAYDKSEADTSDNKKEVKNEDDEAKEKKAKEEEKKEDVDNKKKSCDNSVENSKVDYFAQLNEIYNASTEPPKQDEYVSRADRLKAAEEYFG